MAEALLYQSDPCTLDYTPDAAVTGGEVIQLKDGRAAVIPVDVASGAKGAAQTSGIYKVAKTTDIVILDGGKVFWDHSANKAHFKKVADRDFLIGVAVGDAASSDTTMYVNLNVKPEYVVDIANDPFVTAIVKTAGAPSLNSRGGALNILLDSTNEAQKVDALSKDGFAIGANAIVEFAFAVPNDGAGAAVDVSVGVANATHATDADAITEHLLMHLDANNTNINFQSKDGSTTVAAADSTKDYTEGAGNRVEVWMDLRTPADAKLYVDAVEVLASTAWNVSAVASTLKLLCHIEKTAAADVYEFDLDWLRARIAQQ